MTDEEETYECEYCDFQAANAAGLAAHERSHPSSEAELEEGEVEQAVKEVEVESQESSDEESTDEESDDSPDEDCYRCGDSADLVHDVGRGLEVPLCEECDEKVSGHRYETKRTLIYFDG